MEHDMNRAKLLEKRAELELELTQRNLKTRRVCDELGARIKDLTKQLLEARMSDGPNAARRAAARVKLEIDAIDRQLASLDAAVAARDARIAALFPPEESELASHA